MNTIYACIDLKSFFASCECVERGLDPFTTNLVVADPNRGSGAIMLAITPAMKELGVKNRCRVYEIPENIEYITAMPRMKLYMKYSADVYAAYLKFVSPEDMHVYSIDEVFIDFTPYLHTYGFTPREFAVRLMEEVYADTGICATAGLGTNLFLAKVALDVTAKHVPDHIGALNEEYFKKHIWRHRPITDIWNIGKGTANRLAKYGIYDLKGVAECDPRLLYKEFGKNAEYLIDHANGIEPCTIADIKAYKSQSNSISNSQILFEDYGYENAKIVLREMVDLLVLELIEKNMVTNSISLSIGYSKDVTKRTGGSRKLQVYTNSYNQLSEEFMLLFEQTTNSFYPIRQIGISLNGIIDENFAPAQLDFFSAPADCDKERRKQEAILEIKQRFGKNAILRGMSYQEKATARVRNTLVGGHNGG